MGPMDVVLQNPFINPNLEATRGVFQMSSTPPAQANYSSNEWDGDSGEHGSTTLPQPDDGIVYYTPGQSPNHPFNPIFEQLIHTGLTHDPATRHRNGPNPQGFEAALTALSNDYPLLIQYFEDDLDIRSISCWLEVQPNQMAAYQLQDLIEHRQEQFQGHSGTTDVEWIETRSWWIWANN